MSRPSFQFYTKDWRANSKLRRCSPAARGVWVDILCALHDSDEYGIARYSLKELASEVGASLALCRELVDKGVLKGADAGDVGPYIYTPRSGRKDGAPVTLLLAQPGPLWYSSRMVKDEYINTHRGEATRFGGGKGETPKPAPKPSPTRREGDGPSIASASATASRDPPPPSGVGPPSAAPKPPRAAKRCPATFLVDGDLQRWAREKAPLVDIRAETALFRDWEFKTARSDWPAAWRTWISKEQKRLAEKRPTNGAGGLTDVGFGMETLAERTRRERIADMSGGLASRQPTRSSGLPEPALNPPEKTHALGHEEH